MNKREMIMVALATCAAIGGGGIYISDMISKKLPPSGGGNETAQLSAMVDDMVAKEEKNATREYILLRAMSDDGANPFFHKKFTEKQAETKTQDVAMPMEKFDYSGYLEVGSVRIAVVNGREYRVGDRLERYGYTVQSITEKQVVLTGANNRKVTVPYR